MVSDAVSARRSVEKVDGVSTNFCLQFGETHFKGAEPTRSARYSLCISVVLRPSVRVDKTGTVRVT